MCKMGFLFQENTRFFFLFCFWKKKKKKVWTGIKSWYCKTNKMENTWEKESFLSEFQNKFTRTFLSLWCLYFKQRRKDWASQQRPQCQRVALYWEQGTQLSHPPKHPRSKSCTSAPHPEGKKRFRVSWDQTAIPAPGWNCWKENHLKIQKIVTAEVWKSSKTIYTIKCKMRWERQTKIHFQFLKILHFPPPNITETNTLILKNRCFDRKFYPNVCAHASLVPKVNHWEFDPGRLLSQQSSWSGDDICSRQDWTFYCIPLKIKFLFVERAGSSGSGLPFCSVQIQKCRLTPGRCISEMDRGWHSCRWQQQTSRVVFPKAGDGSACTGLAELGNRRKRLILIFNSGNVTPGAAGCHITSACREKQAEGWGSCSRTSPSASGETHSDFFLTTVHLK